MRALCEAAQQTTVTAPDITPGARGTPSAIHSSDAHVSHVTSAKILRLRGQVAVTWQLHGRYTAVTSWNTTSERPMKTVATFQASARPLNEWSICVSR